MHEQEHTPNIHTTEEEIYICGVHAALRINLLDDSSTIQVFARL